MWKRAAPFVGVVAVVAGTAGTACGGDEAKRDRQGGTDGGGIAGSVDTIRATVVTAIGSTVSGADAPYRVFSGFFEGADRFVVSNGGGPDIRRYTVTGVLLASFGRSGDGPGEFRRLAWVGELGSDSLLAYDAGTSRFSVFDREGRFGRSFTVEGLGLRGRQPSWIETADREALFVAMSTGLPEATMYEGRDGRDSLRIVRTSLRGGMGEVLAVVPNRWWRHVPNAQAFEIEAVSTGPFAVVALGGSELLYSSNTAPVIRRSNVEQGRAEREWRLEGVEPLRDPAVGDDQLLRYFEQLVVSGNGVVWVSTATVRPDGTRSWLKLDANGAVDAVMFLPGRLRLLDIAEPLALGRRVDPLGVEYLQVLRLEGAR